MKESCEKIVRVGLERLPRSIFDEVELTSAEMIRDGWHLVESRVEESLGNIHLFFERTI